MNALDITIILVIIIAALQGAGVGFVRTATLALGTIAGVYVSAILSTKLLLLVGESSARMMILILITIAIVSLFINIAIHAGHNLQQLVDKFRPIASANKVLGIVLAGATVLIAISLMATMFEGTPQERLKSQISGSKILSSIDERLPSIRPQTFNKVAYLLDPYGFPSVFATDEPELGRAQGARVSSEQLSQVVNLATDSVVKIESQACGSVALGTGFNVDPHLAVTNAHVVAGSQGQVTVVESSGRQQQADVVWFDPSLDLAVLRVPNPFTSKSLQIGPIVGDNTQAVVIGYPGGVYGTNDAIVIRRLVARGYDIYNQYTSVRQVYALDGSIVPGNSGGPLLGLDGKVLGVIFGHSPTQPHVGYALTTDGLSDYIALANRNVAAVKTGGCTGH